MILFVPGEPLVRAVEADLAGRRIAVRAFPCGGEAGPAPFRFDPVERRMILRPAQGRAEVGPADAMAWRRAIGRAPAGPVLLGPGSAAGLTRECARAAAQGAREAGRAVYLLDPDPAGLPEDSEGPFAAVFSGVPDEAMWGNLEASSRRMPSGLLLPVIPGWTAEDSFLDAIFARAPVAGALFVAAVAAADDGDSRRRLVAARGLAEPGSEEAFFDRVHHGDWQAETARALERMLALASRAGLACRPPRPRGEGEPPGNVAAAARLEELAERGAGSEHRAALLRAAVRWLDEVGRDLRPVVAEGNFGRIFPFDPEIAPDVERALAGPLP
ncbi:MAG: hypothetical protein ACM3SU_03525 [Acidobacteriota bacterium]